MNSSLFNEISSTANAEGYEESKEIVFWNYSSFDQRMKTYEYQGENAFDWVAKAESLFDQKTAKIIGRHLRLEKDPLTL